ncbi:MAG: glycoside hydrolase family 140 protein [Bacteroidales bacterium]
MKQLIFCWSLCAVLTLYGQETVWEGPSVEFSHGRLTVSENGRVLIFEDGTPFFYLGDTAWELFHRLNREEAVRYLENRREKGFTVIQAVVLAELDGLNDPNPYGHIPLTDNDPESPGERYFEHVDFIIQAAREKGLFIGLLPTWGDKVDKRWGVGPVVFNEKNAYAYGRWLGKRYKDVPNIIWINGGDRPCEGETGVWDALGKGIRSADKQHLITFHPSGGSFSSACFHHAEWLDFNMFQSGHSEKYISNYRMIAADYDLWPVKPCMDGEPCYEDHPVNWDGKFGWFDDEDVRRAAYWALFSGAHGHTYGCHPVWQMLDEGRTPVGNARHGWHQVLDLPGAWDMIHARNLMESRPRIRGMPDSTMIASGEGNEVNHVQAFRGEGFAYIYLPANRSVAIDPAPLEAEMVRAWWFNPRTGGAEKIGEFEETSQRTFTTPVSGVDWILVIDDADMDYHFE